MDQVVAASIACSSCRLAVPCRVYRLRQLELPNRVQRSWMLAALVEHHLRHYWLYCLLSSDDSPRRGIEGSATQNSEAGSMRWQNNPRPQPQQGRSSLGGG